MTTTTRATERGTRGATMAKDGERIDPASIRLSAGSYEYRLGMRVMTPEGAATITGFDFQSYEDIGVTLDSTGEEVYTTWQHAIPLSTDCDK